MQVFIVEDSPLVLERLRAMVSDLECADLAGDARDLAEAVGSIIHVKPDLVLLDLRLPGGTGLDVLKSIKQAPDAPLVMVLTNHPDDVCRERCMQEGADFFFDKSIEYETAVEVVRTLCATREKRRPMR